MTRPFLLQPGRCFAITNAGVAGRPEVCPEKPTVVGVLIDSKGERHSGVEACREHARELVEFVSEGAKFVRITSSTVEPQWERVDAETSNPGLIKQPQKPW